MSQWISIESRQVMASVDQEAVGRLAGAVRSLDRVTARLPGTLHVMRDWMSGQPQAAITDRSGGASAWCWAHERSAVECDRAGLLCAGEVIGGPSDPVGSAAVVPDRAAGHHRELIRRVEMVARVVAEIEQLVDLYPTAAVERAAVDDPGPGGEWCRCCWKDRKHCTPITLRPDGQPFYRGLCRWCGQTSKDLGAEPPTWLVAKRHRGERITEGMMAKARTEVAGRGRKRKAKARS